MIFDTHAHYDSSQFKDDRDAVLTALPESGVGLAVNPGCDLPSSEYAVRLSERFPHIWAAVGVHPSDCGGEAINYDRLRELAEREKTVAIGEIGLDYYWKDNPPREFQQTVFRKQIELALELDLPVIVHDREAHQDSLNVVLDYPELLSKFTVLLQAGLAARNVWERMVMEYEGQKKSGKKPRYAYEEMEITWNQMKNGMYESRAYGEFGRRCGLHPYMKFGALLEQNLRQGTTGLALRLKEEAALAFEERKNLARRLGEEAETRLMLPMFLMLFMVLTVIMVPAFLSF